MRSSVNDRHTSWNVCQRRWHIQGLYCGSGHHPCPSSKICGRSWNVQLTTARKYDCWQTSLPCEACRQRDNSHFLWIVIITYQLSYIWTISKLIHFVRTEKLLKKTKKLSIISYHYISSNWPAIDIYTFAIVFTYFMMKIYHFDYLAYISSL